MSGQLPNSSRRSTSGFQKLVDGFFKQEGLPFSEVITASKIEETFLKHDGLFGIGMIYSTATVLWAFLGQVSVAASIIFAKVIFVAANDLASTTI